MLHFSVLSIFLQLNSKKDHPNRMAARPYDWGVLSQRAVLPRQIYFIFSLSDTAGHTRRRHDSRRFPCHRCRTPSSCAVGKSSRPKRCSWALGCAACSSWWERPRLHDHRSTSLGWHPNWPWSRWIRPCQSGWIQTKWTVRSFGAVKQRFVHPGR